VLLTAIHQIAPPFESTKRCNRAVND
jgi:hypothetical protein